MVSNIFDKGFNLENKNVYKYILYVKNVLLSPFLSIHLLFTWLKMLLFFSFLASVLGSIYLETMVVIYFNTMLSNNFYYLVK